MASLTSSTLYGGLMPLSYPASSSSSRSSYSAVHVLCQQPTLEISEQRLCKVPRRSFAVASVLVALIEAYSAQEAQAARNKTAATTEKQPEEDKSLSAYDAKLLATYRRKEAMKEALAKQRAKATPIPKPDATKVAKPEAEVTPKSEPETPTASVVASEAPKAVKEAVESVPVPSSE